MHHRMGKGAVDGFDDDGDGGDHDDGYRNGGGRIFIEHAYHYCCCEARARRASCGTEHMHVSIVHGSVLRSRSLSAQRT